MSEKIPYKIYLSEFCAGLLLLFVLVSCASTSGIPSDFRALSNLSDLYGTWMSSQGEYEYPFVVDGKKYLRYALAPTDDTAKWLKYAESHSLDLGDVWKKRFALSSAVYASENGEILEQLPRADENGTQMGRKFFVSDEKIFSRIEVLIPERILSINLDFFLIRKDSLALRERNVFHLASDTFPDITADDTLYFKLKEGTK